MYISVLFSLLSISRAGLALYTAAIYTGYAAYCDDGLTRNSSCWDAAAWLLGNSTLGFSITFLDQTQLNDTELTGFDLYVQPGGGNDNTDYDGVWADMNLLSPKIRSYIAGGGRYLGICQGGYLAGNLNDTLTVRGFNMLPADVYIDEESIQDGTQVPSNDDAIIQVDYTLINGKTLADQWLFFQDGTALFATEDSDCSDNLQVLGSYSADGNFALGLAAYQKGIVGISGPHIEADRSFWDSDDFTNPDNKKDPTNGYLIGKDFLKQLMAATPSSIHKAASSACA